MPQNNIYQLKIILDGSKPPIWRRVLVKSDTKLSQLHEIIQSVFGWQGHHMHHFFQEDKSDIFGRQRFYGKPHKDDDEDFPVTDYSKVTISDLLLREKARLYYEYDFGDSWIHGIVLEKILDNAPDDVNFPLCVAGKKACPPDDCGGIWGYYDMLEWLADVKHPEHKNIKRWLKEMGKKDFDPDYFNIDEINACLKRDMKKVA